MTSNHIPYLQKLVNALDQQRQSHTAHVKTVMDKAKELLGNATIGQGEAAQPNQKG